MTTEDRGSELLDRILDLCRDGDYSASEVLDALSCATIHILKNEINEPIEVALAQYRYACQIGEAWLKGEIKPEDSVPWDRRQ